MSDHGLAHCYSDPCSEREAAVIFNAARSGKPVSSAQQAQYAAFLILFFGQLDAEKGWTKQLHLGALRSVIHARHVNWDPTRVSTAWVTGRKPRGSAPT